MPSMMWGIGSDPSESIETWALWRSTLIADLTITTPRSKGPTVAESTATTEKSEPWKGPAR